MMNWSFQPILNSYWAVAVLALGLVLALWVRPSYRQLSAARRRALLADFVAAQQAMADMPSAQFNLAALARVQGDAEGAERHYRRAIGREPGFQAARLGLATLLAAHGREEEAGDALRAGLPVSADPAALRAHVTALVAALRTKASLVMSHEWQSQATRLDSLRHLHLLALMSVLGAAVAGLGLVAILIDRERRLMSGQLDHLRAELVGSRWSKLWLGAG